MNSGKIRKQYLQILPKLQDTLSLVQDRLSDLPQPDFELDINLKPFESVKRKMGADHLKKITDMSDLVRGRLFFSDQYISKEIIKLMKELLHDWIKKIDVKRHGEYNLQYHGIIHIDLNIDGISFELQIMPIEYKPFKLFFHKIYELLREPKNNLSEEQKAKLIKKHNKIYEAVYNKAQSNRGLN